MINKANNRIEIQYHRPPLVAPNDEKRGRVSEAQKRRAVLDLAELLDSWGENVLDLEQCYKWLTEFRRLLNFIGRHSTIRERYLAPDGRQYNLGEILESVECDLKVGLDLAKSKGRHFVELKQEGRNLIQDLSRELRERVWRLS